MSSPTQSNLYDRLARRLDLAIGGDYPTWTAHADALLRTIGEATETDTRRMLWERLLTRFSLIVSPADKVQEGQPVGVGLSHEMHDAVLERIEERVRSFVERLLKENRSSASTAMRLMRFMGTLASADEQCVALTIVLRSPLVPYAQIPSDLFAHPFPDLERSSMSEDVLQSMALMSRVIRDGKRSRADKIVALAHLVRKARSEQDAQLVLMYARYCWDPGNRGGAQDGSSRTIIAIPIAELGKAVGEALGDIRQELERRGDRPCADPNCPWHGPGRKSKTDKPS